MPSDHYATQDWVADKLVPTLGNIATQLGDLHKDVKNNQGGDYITQLILIVLVADSRAPLCTDSVGGLGKEAGENSLQIVPGTYSCLRQNENLPF